MRTPGTTRSTSMAASLKPVLEPRSPKLWDVHVKQKRQPGTLAHQGLVLDRRGVQGRGQR